MKSVWSISNSQPERFPASVLTSANTVSRCSVLNPFLWFRTLAFRCVLPGTDFTLQGHVDVIWASDQGRAGLFFSKLSPAARKQLKRWLGKRSAHGKNKHKNTVHDLMPPEDAHVSFSVSE